MASCPAALQVTLRGSLRFSCRRSIAANYASSGIRNHFAIADRFHMCVLEFISLRNLHSKILNHTFQSSQSLQQLLVSAFSDFAHLPGSPSWCRIYTVDAGALAIGARMCLVALDLALATCNARPGV